MNHCLSLIRLLVIGHALFTVSQCGDNENDEEVFKFQVELIDTMWTAMDSTAIKRKGWPLTKDTKTLRKMAVGAAKYISFEFKNPSDALSDTHLSMSDWGHPTYPDKSQEDEYINYLYFGATPRGIYIRAADGPQNEYSYIIMVEGFQHSWQSVYGMSPREYIFDIKIMQRDPVQSKNEMDLLSTIENVDLRKVYQQMEFLDMMLVCLMAMDNTPKQFPMFKPQTTPSPIGLRPLKLYNYKRDQLEEHVGYRCPIEPPFYVYFEDSKSVGVALVVEPQH